MDLSVAARLTCRSLPSSLARAADGALLVLLAPRCAICDGLLDRLGRGPVCAACWASVPVFTPPLCETCGEPLGWADPVLCGQCVGRARDVDRAGAIGPYEGALREIVHVLKYQGRRSVAGRLSALMRDHQAGLLAGADAVVPVPLHWRRQQARGFNQAADLAAALGPPVWHALRRASFTRSQVELAAGERLRNVRRAFALSRRGGWWQRRGRYWRRALDGKCVVLVDDVTTTGATLEACAAVLKDAGAREVRALTAARTVSTRR